MTAAGDLIAACRQLASRGLSPGSSGNVSVRVGDEILITPTGSSLSRVDEGALVRLDLSGRATAGAPSKEWPLHLAVYAKRESARAVVHLHSPYSTALACLPADEQGCAALAALTPYAAIRLGELPVAPYAAPGSVELAAGVSALAAAHPAIILANHGSVVAASTLYGAVDLAEELETAATVDFLTLGRSPVHLTDDQLRGLHHG